MNVALVKRDSKLLIYGLPTAVVLFATAFTFTKLPATYPELAIGITIDLTLTAPLLFLFLVRKTNTSKLFAATFFGVGILIASYGIPYEEQYLLNNIKYWVLPAIEFIAFVFIGHSAYRAVKIYKTERNKIPDILQVLQETTEKMLGQNVLAKFAAFEAAVIYYAILSWKKPAKNTQQFTYHKNSGAVVTYGAFGFLIVAETIVIHVLVEQWSEIAAWIFTLSSLYVLVLILAQIKAIFQRPIEITDEKLFVRYGIFGETEIDLENIERIETGMGFSEEESGLKKIAIFEQCNTKIQLKKEATAFGFYRFKSNYITLLFYVDEKEKLKKLIEQNVPN